MLKHKIQKKNQLEKEKQKKPQVNQVNPLNS